MIVFSIIMLILSFVNLFLGALQLDLTGALWIMWTMVVLLTYSCGLVVDGKNKQDGDYYAVAKNKKSVGVANLIFSLILIILSFISFIKCILNPREVCEALIKEWVSIIIFSFSIHQIVSAGHEARELEEEEEEEQHHYTSASTSHVVQCPNCNSRLVAHSNSPYVRCSCGKTYKNPYYKG